MKGACLDGQGGGENTATMSIFTCKQNVNILFYSLYQGLYYFV